MGIAMTPNPFLVSDPEHGIEVEISQADNGSDRILNSWNLLN
jgi:hypothetical protein